MTTESETPAQPELSSDGGEAAGRFSSDLRSDGGERRALPERTYGVPIVPDCS